MTQPTAEDHDATKTAPRRWLWRLVGFFALTVCATVVTIAYRYHQQMAFIERCGETYITIWGKNVTTIPRGPDWLREKVGSDRMRGFEPIASINELPQATTADLELLSRHPIRRLRQYDSDLTSADISLLAEMKELESLDFIDCRLSSEASILPLQDLPGLKKLTFQDISLAPQHFTQIGRLQQLESLELDHTGITDEALASLARLLELKELTILFSPISDEGVVCFYDHPALESLTITGSNVTEKGFAQLSDHLPGCSVEESRMVGDFTTSSFIIRVPYEPSHWWAFWRR